MYTKKKLIIISLLSALAAGIIFAIAGYAFALQSEQIEKADLYGTYQFHIRNMENIEYLAVIPPSSADANESKGEFQWYNIDQKMLAQGQCKIHKEGFITLYADGKSVATIFIVDKKYYFVDNLSEPQEITKISEEPMVSDEL